MPVPSEDTDWNDGDSEVQLSSDLPTPVDDTLGSKPLRLIRDAWKPEPVEPPTVDRELPRLSWPERCAEAIRFAVLAAEHWLSRQGILREWLRLNLWVGTALLALALLVVPPVTMLLEGTAKWAGLVEATAANIVATVSGLPPVVIALATVLIAFRLLHRSWLRRRHQRRYRNQDDPYGMQ